LQFPYILFTDWIQINFTLTVNPMSIETPKASSMALGLDATTLARVACKMSQFPSPTTLFPANATAYYHCGDMGAVSYLIAPTGDDNPKY
jgi:hypothetical protein